MFFVPILCVHYRTGNALEQITKFLGTLGGVFGVSKVMNKSHLIKALRERVHAALEATLVIYQQQPAALQEEWREAKARLVDLAGSFQEAGDVANVGDHGVAIVRLKRWLSSRVRGRVVAEPLSKTTSCFTWRQRVAGF